MMAHGGVAKLVEEAGEVVQEAGKALAFGMVQPHPDGGGPIGKRLEQELGDLLGIISFVIRKHDLDSSAIQSRASAKLATFNAWDAEEALHS